MNSQAGARSTHGPRRSASFLRSRYVVPLGIALVLLVAGAGFVAQSVVTPPAPSGGAQLTGTVTESGNDVVVVKVSGAPQAGKLSGSIVRARVSDDTTFRSGLSRGALPGPGVPVTLTVRVPAGADGVYEVLEIRADAR